MANNLVLIPKQRATQHFVDAVIPASSVGGGFLTLGALGTDGTYTTAAPSGIADLGMVLLVPVCLPYGAEVEEKDYVLATGAVERATFVEKGDEYDIPVENITATVAVAADAYLIPDASAIKPECVDTLGGTEAIVLKITKTFTKAGQSYARGLVVKA